MEKPLVSIICTAYNHVGFIDKTLAGFVGQKTSFPFEIIINDDASTDGTADRIRRWEKEYPSIIKPLYQNKNLYSQGISITSTLCARAKGKYIALCEGDDYWIDLNKLQKQVEYLEQNPLASFCFSNAYLFDVKKDSFTGLMLQATDNEREILQKSQLTTDDVLQLTFLPTASFIFKRTDYERRPVFSDRAFTGDRYYQIVMTNFGYAHYFDEPMVCYRTNNPSSMMGFWHEDKQSFAQICWKYIYLYREFDEYTEGKYQLLLQRLIMEREYAALCATGDANGLKERTIREYICGLNRTARLKHVVRCLVLGLLSALRSAGWKNE